MGDSKYGRFGEVYVPNKKDRWGRQFGFVKYKEVANVEEMSNKPGNVWAHGEGKSAKDTTVSTRKSFKTTLKGETSGTLKESKEHESLEKGVEKEDLASEMVLEPNKGFLHVLEGGYVASLVGGCSIKTIQLNLCLEGIRGIRAAPMGDGLVLLFSEVGEDVGMAIGKKVWWEGLLVNFCLWTPLLMSSKREVWVRIYGTPLHLWDEKIFQTLTHQWGQFIGLDEDTRNRTRFDMARVK
ncbi:DUF4283 domain protein, partial [Trifolium medium]|nr:DUF4283 domain protein [Trifolium medium]